MSLTIGINSFFVPGATELCGDGEIVTQVDKIKGNGFAGISFRESLDPGSRMLGLYRQAHNYHVYQDVRLSEHNQAQKHKMDFLAYSH